ncbi:MAG TPA: 4-hydroxythreonine-4-phosphate dehydrogenase PdxA [Balneolaceae bacterium]|nr:4-hydroxythreonine-4-phosphate dehydrogenase PdxA [Balneolaceae bacterium]
MNYRMAISSGDFNGIGPEVILKTLGKRNQPGITPIILSSSEIVDFYIDRFAMDFEYHHATSVDDIKDEAVNVLESYGDEKVTVSPGAFTRQSGKCAMLSVERGIELCKKELADALVTAPISKEAVNLAGYSIPGHTEFLAEKTGTDDFMMMLVNDNLRVGLATVHIPIAEVVNQLSEDSILRYARIMNQSLKNDFNIAAPKIAVLGLNPHAGDGGIIGREEIEFITPALEKARGEGIELSGPHPADGFFGNRKYEQFDGILAMYHDQGLIPFKTLSFGKGVNFTAGLPIIRTSPDHGTAFDIAGKNKANASSFNQAFELALKLAENRTSKVSL